LVFSLGGGDDAIQIGGPGERLRFRGVLVDEAVDGGPMMERKTPRLSLRLAGLSKVPSTAMSQEEEVDRVKS
jgi:hypothetical protein